MAKQTRNTLKGLFETGKKPTGANYADLIDSFSLVDGENTGSIDIQGNITTSGDLIINGDITASGNISASGTIFADTFQSHGSTEIGVSDSLNVTGGITASNISSSGFVSASAFSGDGSGLTNITASSLSIQQITASYLSGSTNVLYGVQSSGSIIPDSSSAWDLGGPSHQWKDVFLAGNISSSNGTGSFNSIEIREINPFLNATIALNAEINQSSSLHFFGGGDIVAGTNFKLNSSSVVDFTSGSGNLTIGGGGTSNTLFITAPTVNFSGNITSSTTSTSSLGFVNTTGNINTSGNISASGKISSSGGFESDNSASFGHISASGDLKVDGFASFGGFGNVQSMTSTTSVPANTNMLLYGPITLGTSATLDIAVGSQVLVKDFLNA